MLSFLSTLVAMMIHDSDWCARRESDPLDGLGRPVCDHYITDALSINSIPRISRLLSRLYIPLESLPVVDVNIVYGLSQQRNVLSIVIILILLLSQYNVLQLAQITT